MFARPEAPRGLVSMRMGDDASNSSGSEACAKFGENVGRAQRSDWRLEPAAVRNPQQEKRT